MAPIIEEREKAIKHLQGKYFCLYKLKAGNSNIGKDYKSVVCEYYPSRLPDCPDFEKWPLKVINLLK